MGCAGKPVPGSSRRASRASFFPRNIHPRKRNCALSQARTSVPVLVPSRTSGDILPCARSPSICREGAQAREQPYWLLIA